MLIPIGNLGKTNMANELIQIIFEIVNSQGGHSLRGGGFLITVTLGVKIIHLESGSGCKSNVNILF